MTSYTAHSTPTEPLLEIHYNWEKEEGRFQPRIFGQKDMPRFCAWSLHKAGSSLFTAMLTGYLRALDVQFINLPGQVFSHGLPSPAVTRKGYESLFGSNISGFIGWRNAHPLENANFDFSKMRHVLLVRDPRDRLTSWYHSIAKSHSLPNNGAMRGEMLRRRRVAVEKSTIDKWLEEGNFALRLMRDELAAYHRTLPSESTRIYRYEDIIFRKEEFLTDIIWFLGMVPEPETVSKVATKNDILPEVADPNKHIRRVKYGSHKSELAATSITLLDRTFSSQLDAYRYCDEAGFGERLVFAYEGDEAAALLAKDVTSMLE